MNSSIAVQGWMNQQCERPVGEYRGQVLSDTSFNLTHYVDKGDLIAMDEITYYFKAFSPKPDSTNDYIN